MYGLATRSFSAYGVCEQLGVTVQGASSSRPSIVKRVWDTDIRKNLERRLTNRRIDPAKTILWYVRGTDTRVERKRRDRSGAGKKARWAHSQIRDELIPICRCHQSRWLDAQQPSRAQAGQGSVLAHQD
jgi:hypothetical protein